MKQILPVLTGLIFTFFLCGCGVDSVSAPTSFDPGKLPDPLPSQVSATVAERFAPSEDEEKALSVLPKLARIRYDQLLSIEKKLAPLSQQLGAPRYGEWRSTWHQKRQTLANYITQGAVTADDRHRTVYLQPFDDLTAKDQLEVQKLAAFLRIFLAMPVTIQPTIKLDAIPQDKRRQTEGHVQILAPYLLDEVLFKSIPQDAACRLGILTTDLYRGSGYDFLFGQAGLYSRVGVISFSRLYTENVALFRKRMYRVAAHETLHMFTIAHEPDLRCLMNGCNKLEHFDTVPLWCSPETLGKFLWATSAEAEKRFHYLAEFYNAEGFTLEADYCTLARSLLSAPFPSRQPENTTPATSTETK